MHKIETKIANALIQNAYIFYDLEKDRNGVKDIAHKIMVVSCKKRLTEEDKAYLKSMAEFRLPSADTFSLISSFRKKDVKKLVDNGKLIFRFEYWRNSKLEWEVVPSEDFYNNEIVPLLVGSNLDGLNYKPYRIVNIEVDESGFLDKA